ncbi:MAG: porin [Pseudomonadales bacterium]|nr:porin [Pseudomonadales bacterium]
MIKKLSTVVAATMATLAAGAWADTAPAAPTLDQILAASGITEQGYIEAAYTHYNFAAPNTANGAPTSLNYFDNKANTFDLKQAFLQLSKLPAEGVGGLVNITTGSDADQIKSYPYSTGAASNSYDLTQAFLQYSHGIYSGMAGKFNTLAGAETINDTTNTNISHSIAFLNAIPFTHTGARLTVSPTSTLSLMLGSVNGWDQQKDMNAAKTTELGLAYNPTAMVSWTLQGYTGQETATAPSGPAKLASAISGLSADRTLVDTVLTIKPTSALSLILNGDYAQQKDAFVNGNSATWSAVDVYINYQYTPAWRTSVRLEDFDDKDGYKLGYGVGSTKSYTATVGYSPVPALELRGELREDKAPSAVIPKGSGFTDTVQYVALEGIYKF